MKDLLKTLGLCLLIGGPIGLYQYREKLNDDVVKVADINKDGITNQSELEKVYKELEIQYNESNPKKLGIIECKKYLSNHKTK